MLHTAQAVPRGQHSKTSSVTVNFTAVAALQGQARNTASARAVLPARLQVPDTDTTRDAPIAAIIGERPGGRQKRARLPRVTRLFVLATAVLAGACATTGGPAATAPVDLTAARAAVASAREQGAPQHAAEALALAEKHLREAERLAAEPKPLLTTMAAHQADLAIAHAQHATASARLAASREAAPVKATSTAEAERPAAARLRRLEDEHRKLEDKLAVLQRDLELTETELIRAKARVKGNETKAEASAAIAEARILVRRLAQDRARASSYARGQASLERAEEQLKAGNFGAAIFFAQKAQDTATRAHDRSR
jgi:hypothetical protein